MISFGWYGYVRLIHLGGYIIFRWFRTLQSKAPTIT